MSQNEQLRQMFLRTEQQNRDRAHTESKSSTPEVEMVSLHLRRAELLRTMLPSIINQLDSEGIELVGVDLVSVRLAPVRTGPQPFSVRPFKIYDERNVVYRSFNTSEDDGSLKHFSPDQVRKEAFASFLRRPDSAGLSQDERSVMMYLSCLESVLPLVQPIIESDGHLHIDSQRMRQRWNASPYLGETDFVEGVLKRDPDALKELYEQRLKLELPEITWTSRELFPGYTLELPESSDEPVKEAVGKVSQPTADTASAKATSVLTIDRSDRIPEVAAPTPVQQLEEVTPTSLIPKTENTLLEAVSSVAAPPEVITLDSEVFGPPAPEAIVPVETPPPTPILRAVHRVPVGPPPELAPTFASVQGAEVATAPKVATFITFDFDQPLTEFKGGRVRIEGHDAYLILRGVQQAFADGKTALLEKMGIVDNQKLIRQQARDNRDHRDQLRENLALAADFVSKVMAVNEGKLQFTANPEAAHASEAVALVKKLSKEELKALLSYISFQ